MVFQKSRPVAEKRRTRRVRLVVVDHRNRHVEDALFEPALPVLEHGAVGGAVHPVVAGLGSVAPSDERAADHEAGLERGRLRIDFAHHCRHLVAPPLAPKRVGRVGLARAPVAAIEPRHTCRIVAPPLARVADVIEVDAVDGVAAHDVQHDFREPLVIEWVSPVAAVAHWRDSVAVVVFGLDFGGAVQDMLGVVGPAAAWPNRVAVDPHMHLEARGLAARFFNQVRQRVETRLLVGSERLQRREIVCVAALAHLHDDSVHLRRARRCRSVSTCSGVWNPSLKPSTQNPRNSACACASAIVIAIPATSVHPCRIERYCT
jgi:hypothetical protein